MKKEESVYYAHSKQFYDSVREINEYAFLYDYYSPQKVINPAHLNLKGMGKYLELVSQCNTLVASEYEDHIGKGVFLEICQAFVSGIPVKVIRRVENKYELFEVTGIQVINENDWKVKYAKIITK